MVAVSFQRLAPPYILSSQSFRKKGQYQSSFPSSNALYSPEYQIQAEESVLPGEQTIHLILPNIPIAIYIYIYYLYKPSYKANNID